jgi:hypothetical protein
MISEIKLVTALSASTPDIIKDELYSGQLKVSWKKAKIGTLDVKNVVLETGIETHLSAKGIFSTRMRLICHIDNDRVLYGYLNKPEYIEELFSLVKKMQVNLATSRTKTSEDIWNIVDKF